jgi:methyl-accepting chemotaxis protein
MVSDIQETARLIEQISLACNEQLDGIHQVDDAIRSLDFVVKQNAHSAEETAQKSGELSIKAQRLQDNVEFFKVS